SESCRVTLLSFVRAATSKRIDAQQVESEATAQFRKIQAAGIAISHFDSHKHVHLFPVVYEPLLRAAKACNIPAVRNPFAPIKPLAFAHLLRRPNLWKRYTQVQLLRRYEEGFRKAVADAGLKTTNGSFGIVSTGALNHSLMEAIVGNIPEGTWEFVCHPG